MIPTTRGRTRRARLEISAMKDWAKKLQPKLVELECDEIRGELNYIVEKLTGKRT